MQVYLLQNLQETLDRDTLLEARNGKRLLALDIFSKALNYLKERALERIHEQSGVEYTAEEVRWVVTVPAIWKQSAKQFMREAAYKVSCENFDLFFQQFWSKILLWTSFVRKRS